jgi:hypothetical protein
LPLCDAAKEHVPTFTMVTSSAETVQTSVDVEVNVTVRPEVVVGDNSIADAAHALSVGSVNVIV